MEEWIKKKKRRKRKKKYRGKNSNTKRERERKNVVFKERKEGIQECGRSSLDLYWMFGSPFESQPVLLLSWGVLPFLHFFFFSSIVRDLPLSAAFLLSFWASAVSFFFSLPCIILPGLRQGLPAGWAGIYGLGLYT